MKTVELAPASSGLAHPRPARTAPRGLVASGGRQLTTLLVVVLTGIALWIRIDGLQGWDGTLTVDESRLALAARGVLESGLPRLPSGWLYTRGLLVTYLTAPSFALLGETDFAARLPAVLAGTALIPVAYLLGREVGGRLGGLFVAALPAGHPSFVIWSRQAWFYAPYLLVFAAALLFILRAARTGRDRDQLLAGLLVGLSAFAHELGLFLLLPLAAQIFLRLRRERRTPAAWRAPLASLALVGAAGVVLWLLVTRLRAASLAGAYGEIGEYFDPSVEWPRIRFYLRMLLDGPGLMLTAALAGLPLAIRRRLESTLLLWLALLPTFLHAAFLIPRGPQERYGLVLVLVIAVLAAQSVRMLVDLAAAWAARRGGPAITAQLVAGVALAVMLAAHQDVARAIDRAALSPREGAWLRQVRELGIGPDDVVMTDIPTTIAWYVGGLDFWISSRDYEKYTTRHDDVRRDVHSDAILVRTRGELDRLVARPLAGRPVWIIASGRSYQWGELVDDDLKAALERSASQKIYPGDGTRLLLVRLPSGS
jgi:4-amino-4-deoxy-L-arabinose transferase-like glycosyltransferase